MNMVGLSKVGIVRTFLDYLWQSKKITTHEVYQMNWKKNPLIVKYYILPIWNLLDLEKQKIQSKYDSSRPTPCTWFFQVSSLKYWVRWTVSFFLVQLYNYTLTSLISMQQILFFLRKFSHLHRLRIRTYTFIYFWGKFPPTRLLEPTLYLFWGKFPPTWLLEPTRLLIWGKFPTTRSFWAVLSSYFVVLAL